MLRIQRVANRQVNLTISGQLSAENLAELQNLIGSETAVRPIVLDLKDLTLVDREAVRFLGHCESGRIKLKNCPAYIREWIARERDGE